jgi:hypothetical protein
VSAANAAQARRERQGSAVLDQRAVDVPAFVFIAQSPRCACRHKAKLTSIIVAVASGVEKGSGARQRRRHDRKKISLDARESRARVKEAIDRGYMGAI